MNKVKSIIDDIIWNVKDFLHQPFIPIVSMDYVIENDGSYTYNNFMTDEYVYYWIGDFKTGKLVKVKSIDVLKYEYLQLKRRESEI